MADYTSSSHPNPDLDNVPYSILAEAYASPVTPPRGRPLKVFTAVAASVVFLVSLIGLIVNHVPETSDHCPTTPSRVLPRGVAEGVSAKSYPTISDEGYYNWTNAMLSWQRTAYHFQPEKNWMNDPNGPLHHLGWYHLFYQYNPDSATWGNITWGHAVSVDLIHWLYLPLAMTPDQHYDRKGVWTGSATILPNGDIKMLYTGDTDNSVQVQNLAYPSNLSDPLLLNWTKYEDNPILVSPEGIGLSDFRDPSTAWVGPDGKWRLLIGSKINTTGLALVYHTTNFTTYERVDHVLHSVARTGMWECVDFYPVSTNSSVGLDTSVVGQDVKHVLKASLDDLKMDYYAIGTYDPVNDTWTPDDASMDVGIGLRYDYGWLYASKSFYDPVKKRRILWGWINETDTESDDFAKGWASVQAVPREILYDNKTGMNVLQQPVEEIESLRLNSTEFEDILVEAGSIVQLDIGMATQLDITAEFEIQGIDSFKATAAAESNITECIYADTRTSYGPFGLAVLADGSLSELTPIYFRLIENDDASLRTYFCADESRSSLAPEVLHTVYGSEIPVLEGEKYTVRTLVDHSIIESFALGGRRVITSRVYPTQAIYGTARLFLFNNATGINVTASLKVFDFADTYRGNYNDSIGAVACSFYCNYNGYQDDLIWGATWLFRATNYFRYWTYSYKYWKCVNDNLGNLGGTFAEFGWDAKHAGIYVLVSKYMMNGSYHFQDFVPNADGFACSILPESPTRLVAYSDGGLLFKPVESNLQHTTALSFLLTVYSRYTRRAGRVVDCGNGVIATPRRLLQVAKSQVDYILGSNPSQMSYMVEYGRNFPQKIHHRGSSLPSVNQHLGCLKCQDGAPFFYSRYPNPNVLTGAVVGGPDIHDQYNDSRLEFTQSEPATYINAPLVGVLAYFKSFSIISKHT